ncbi:LOW QUALITY PROTEIN: hypothetical protein QYF61_027937 [Mycteria americana]|uniref:PA domain-containing protein n=1 Tax=Mycteria americana TaxID=33587 RepID=A0AAN7NZY9_MYCAM|nr:LOW QUALITY PROTEIN: hypothetical protein QYF61_027937 [Mycteria americana]
MLMLSATQIYTILTVQLFAFLNLLPVEADILAYNLENGTQTFDDLPARFGYRLPAEGLKGFLINSKPENACEPIAPPPLKDNSSSAFIVLIRRLECNFDIKVLNAQRAGYKAAIVHNVDSDDLISMGSNDIEVLKKIDIPSVFIGETSANSLKEEFTYEKGGHVVLIPEFSLPLEYYLIPFLIIVGICLILIVIFMITKFVQDRHRARRNRLRKDQLKKLPVHKFKKGNRADTICRLRLRIKMLLNIPQNQYRNSTKLPCCALINSDHSSQSLWCIISIIWNPHRQYCIQLWSPQYKKDMDLLEWVQGRPQKWSEGLRELGLFSLEKRRLRGDLTAAFQYLKGAYKKHGDKLFSRTYRTRGNGFKLKEGRLRLDIRKKFFMLRVVKPWPRLPREVADAPSLETFKVRLDRALSSLI